MVRHRRIVVPGVAHHVTQRGNNKQDVFFSDADYRAYLAFLRSSVTLYAVEVSAFCLMRNHVHIIAVPSSEKSLGRTMARTHQMYTQHINETHERSGHLWQGRYYSCAMDEIHTNRATIYVELNPVRAGIVQLPWEYPWSSAAAHCGESDDPSGLLPLDRWFDDMPASEWKTTLSNIAESDDSMNQLVTHTHSGQPLGAESFVDKVESHLGRPIPSTRRGRPRGSKNRKKRPHI